jgi:hypothetical protein
MVWLGTSAPAAAAVTLPGLFSDHMVAQRNMEVPVWGTDTANQSSARSKPRVRREPTANGRYAFRRKTQADRFP